METVHGRWFFTEGNAKPRNIEYDNARFQKMGIKFAAKEILIKGLAQAY